MKASGWSPLSRHKRGYGTEWTRTRERILARDKGLCQPCLKEGRIHEGTHVDHKVSRANARKLGWTVEQTEADDNLQAINKECHKRKTDAETGRRTISGVGADGWPLEG